MPRTENKDLLVEREQMPELFSDLGDEDSPRGLPTHDFKHHNLASPSFVRKAGDAIRALAK
jgi:hypothetical protein